jgi:Rrf2 family protein
MKLSTRSRYGTRMMVDVAQHCKKGPVRIRDISKRQDISVKYLEQLIIPLKKAEFIKSVRGPKGGYLLAKPPEEITIGEIVRTLEGEISLTRCIDNPEACDRVGICPIRDMWEAATRAIFKVLDAVTLAKLTPENKPLQNLPEAENVYR